MEHTFYLEYAPGKLRSSSFPSPFVIRTKESAVAIAFNFLAERIDSFDLEVSERVNEWVCVSFFLSFFHRLTVSCIPTALCMCSNLSYISRQFNVTANHFRAARKSSCRELQKVLFLLNLFSADTQKYARDSNERNDQHPIHSNSKNNGWQKKLACVFFSSLLFKMHRGRLCFGWLKIAF